MQYICLIYSEEKPPENPEATMQAYGAYNQAIIAAGVFVGGEPLEPTSSSTCVKMRNGKMITTDGPFAESKEQLGGYYLLDCENLDQAIEWAAKIPAATDGTIEVRPVMVLPERPGA